MARLQLDTDGLFSDLIRLLVPTGSVDGAVAERFQKMTGDSSQPIYSGYRQRLLGREGVEESQRLGDELRGRFDNMLVLGIGGSALGAKTCLQALSWTLPEAQRKKVLVADNLDPIEFEELWSACDPRRTVYVVISKSGGTLETMAQMSLVMERLAAAGLPVREHLVAITDPKEGALKVWAAANELRRLAIPPDVGGRFSVLTPVGLLPLAFAGLDIAQLVEGALEQFQGRNLPLDKTLQLGSRLAELERGGFCGHVVMPYSSHLKDFAAWYVQLWGESLGKARAGGGAWGLLPVGAVGATDQHSLLQLLMEGPNRQITGFIRIENWPQTGVGRNLMPPLPPDFAKLSFGFGKSFAELLNAEQKATRQALESRGRPLYEIRLADHGPASVGALLAFYMDLTVATAAALGDINPFDQPGVELGKKILPTLLRG